MVSTVLRAALLDASVYHELRDHPSAFLYALGTLAAAAVAFSIGVWVWALQEVEGAEIVAIPLAGVTTLVGWVIWTLINYLVGVRMLGSGASYRQILRALGVAYGPGVLMFLAAIPGAGIFVFIFSSLWTLASGTVAMKATQQVGWGRAVIPAFFGWVPSFSLALAFLPSSAG